MDIDRNDRDPKAGPDYQPSPGEGDSFFLNPPGEIPNSDQQTVEELSGIDSTVVEMVPTTEAQDRRQSPRTPGRSGVVEVCVIGSSLSRVRTLLGNQSSGGLSIFLPAPVAVGALVAIWPDGSPAEATVAEVRHCLAEGERWRVGCAYLGQPLHNQFTGPDANEATEHAGLVTESTLLV
jgi:hypothetical protein